MKYTQVLLLCVILISSASYAQTDDVMRALESPSKEELNNNDHIRPSTQSDAGTKVPMIDDVMRALESPSKEELNNNDHIRPSTQSDAGTKVPMIDDVMRALESPSIEELNNNDFVRPAIQSNSETKVPMTDDVMRALETPSLNEIGHGGSLLIDQGNEQEKMADVNFSVYPNPTRDGNSFISLRDMNIGVKEISISVVDRVGVTIWSETLNTSTTSLNYSLSQNKVMKPGTYHVSVIVQGQSFHQQWMVQ